LADASVPQSVGSTEALAGTLARTWFGDVLTDHTLSQLALIARRERFDAGEVIFTEGEPTPFLAVVVDGVVDLTSQGRPVLTVEPGDIVGWSTVVTPHRATTTATARTDVDAVLLPAGELRPLLKANSEVAAEVYHRILSSLAHRLQVARMQALT
jgi:CRP/FNR family cyclic AMP-dependent transcriptional regulator